MVLAQRQSIPMQQDRKPRDKPMHLWAPYTKEAGIYNGEKIDSLVSGAGKTRELHVKE